MIQCPYPGLRPFEPEDAELFFGRDEQIEQLLDKLADTRFISVVGLSGCGKSSLVNAGMIPALESGLLPNAGFHWQTVRMRPGNQPLRNLAEALHPILSTDSKQGSHDLRFLLASLRRGPLSLIEIFRETPLPKHTNLLLVVDQFEELFRYHHEGGKEETEAFVKLLLASVTQDEIPIYIVTTMRSEFIGECALFYDLPEMMNAGQFLAPRLTRGQQREAIEEPAKLFGGAIEARLVNTLLNEMGADPDQLPLLQHCLMRMWFYAQSKAGAVDGKEAEQTHTDEVCLSAEEYDAVGALRDALSRHADEAYNELNEKQQKLAETMFRCLTEGDRRRPVAVDEIAKVAQVSPDDIETVTKVFRRVDRCFLRPYGDKSSLQAETILDISHESLIRQWKRLNNWTTCETESAETYKHLKKTACLWQQGKAGLWGTPELEYALKWREKEEPTLEWAIRYGKHFNLVSEFLDISAEKKKEQLKQEEQKRQKKLKQTRLQLTWAVAGLIIALLLAMWALGERRKADQAKVELNNALLKAREANLAADTQRRRAENALVDVLRKNTEIHVAQKRASKFLAVNKMMFDYLENSEQNEQFQAWAEKNHEETLESYGDLQKINEKQSPSQKLIEALEETLKIQRDNNDYEGQEEVVEKIEEQDPNYAQRAVSWLDETDDEHTDSEAELRQKADTFNDIGLVHLRQGNFQKAGSYFLSAERIQKVIGNEQGKALTLSNRATLHYILGQDEKASEMYLESLRLMRKFQDIDGEMQVMNQLALLSYRRGQSEETQQNFGLAESFYAEALKTFHNAVALSHRFEKQTIRGTLLDNQALVYRQLMLFYRRAGDAASETAKAQSYYQHAFRMYQLALKNYKDSLEIIQKLEGRGAGESATLHNLGKLYAALELDSKALDYMGQALELERVTFNYIDRAKILSDIGYLYERRGRRIVHEARDRLNLIDFQWDSLWRRSFVQGFQHLSGFVDFWKTFITGAFTLQQALGFYQQALVIQEDLRTKARLEEFKISFAEESANVYQRSILLLMAMNSPKLAFNMTERARARAFLDQVGNSLLFNPREEIPKWLVTQELKLREDLHRLFVRVKQEQNVPLFLNTTDTIDTITALKQQITQKEQQYEELLTGMKLHNPEYASMISVNPASLEEIQQLLNNDTTLISYFVTPTTTLAFLITSDSFETVELAISAPQLREAVFEARRKHQSGVEYKALENLYDWLIAPLEANLLRPTIGIIPYAVLHDLPFAALKQGDNYLCNRYALFALPSASVLRYLERNDASPLSDKALVFGYKGLPPLQMAEEEAQQIAQIHQVRSFIGREARSSTFLAQAEKASMIHISGRSKIDLQNPLFSGFLLDDAYLTLHDISRLDLSHTGLAVLSGSSTQIGPRSKGDDMIALSRTFMLAGVPTVVASLWNVNDEATSKLMQYFHAYIAEQIAPAEALRQAQMKLRKHYPEPYYWASFTLMGSPGN